MESEEKTKCGVPCAQIFIPEPQNLIRWVSSWDLREAESRESERGGPAVQAEEACWLAWAVEQMRTVETGENQRDTERRRAERKVKFLGFWVILFVLICDCFVVNLLDRICSFIWLIFGLSRIIMLFLDNNFV